MCQWSYINLRFIIIMNDFVSSFRFIWIHILLYIFNSFNAGTDFRRQNPTSKIGPHAEMGKFNSRMDVLVEMNLTISLTLTIVSEHGSRCRKKRCAAFPASWRRSIIIHTGPTAGGGSLACLLSGLNADHTLLFLLSVSVVRHSFSDPVNWVY